MSGEERAARYSDLFAAEHEHRDGNCALCPICATIGVLRKTKPEVLEHLAAAARELVAAAGLLVEEAGDAIGVAEAAAASAAKPAPGGKVRRIDIS